MGNINDTGLERHSVQTGLKNDEQVIHICLDSEILKQCLTFLALKFIYIQHLATSEILLSFKLFFN